MKSEAMNDRGFWKFKPEGFNILSVAMRIGETPVPIPNTTVKTDTADGTAKVGEQVAADIIKR